LAASATSAFSVPELGALGRDEPHPGREGSGAGGVADRSHGEEGGDEAVGGDPHGQAAVGELGWQEIGPGERFSLDPPGEPRRG
jgi:hypothetical protein